MKMRFFSTLVSILVLSTASDLAGYTIQIHPGWNLIANQLDRGVVPNVNTLNTIMPGVSPASIIPNGCRLFKYNASANTFSPISVYSTSDHKWTCGDSITLEPGEGAFLHNPTPSTFELIFEGAPRVSPPLANLSAGYNLLSRQTPDTATYDAIVGTPNPPPDGTIAYTWNGNGWTLHEYIEGYGWEPPWTLRVGEAVFIRLNGGGSPPSLTCANDDCASATPIGLGSLTGDTTCATADGTTSCPGGSPSPDLWYRYTPGCSGTLSVNTCGSASMLTCGSFLDTVLSVHSGCPGTSGTGGNEIVCNNDCPGPLPCAATDSCLSLDVTAGLTYYIRVAGFNGRVGAFNLTLSQVNTTPPAPTGPASQSFCAGNTPTVADLTATGTGIQWYTAASGGAALATSAELASGTYYASQKVSGCEGAARLAVAVTVKTESTAATAATTSANNFCPGGSTTLGVTGGSLGTGASWKWYSDSCGGTFVGAGVSLVVTPATTTTYFVRAEGDCNTTTCVSVAVTVRTGSTTATAATTSANNFCPGGSTTLGVTGGSLGTGASWKWYSDSCGGTLVGAGASLVVTPATTTTYFVRAEGDCNTTTCASVAVTVKTASTAATAATTSANDFCPGGSTTLGVTGGSLGTGASWKWYSGSCGGTPAGTGPSLVVAPTVTTTYFVRAEGDCNTTTCVSVAVTVKTASTAPTSVSATANPVCPGSSTTLNAVGGSLGTGASWKWYTGSCGGTPAGTGPSLVVTPTATTYFVRAEGDCNTTTCASLAVTLKTASTAPTSVSATVNPVCPGSSTTLSVVGGSVGTGASWKWYSGTCGGTAAGTGPSILVSPGTATTYFVRAEGDCNTTACASLAVSVSCPCLPPPANMVAWWPGDNNANDIVRPNNGVLHNGATYAPGKVGPAFYFDGVDDYFQAPTTGLPTGNSARTMDLWVKIDAFVAGESLIAGYGTFGVDNEMYVLATSGSTLIFSQWDNAVLGPTLLVNTWYHVAVTSVGNAVSLYLNGVVVASGTLSISTPGGGQFYMGRLPGSLGDTRRLQGQVDEVEIFNRALTATEIAAIYNAGSAGKCKPSCSISFTCAGDKTVQCGTNWSFNAPTNIVDTCCTNYSLTFSDATNSGPCPLVITRTWLVSDTCGNTNTCSQKVTVEDTTPPVITRCPANRTIVTTANDPCTNAQCLATIPDMRGELVATDNCGVPSVTQSPLGTTVGPGTYAVAFSVFDGCTNYVICTNFVTVTCLTNVLDLPDDGSRNVGLCFTNPICFCGTPYTDLWINNNGYVTFGAPKFEDWNPRSLNNANNANNANVHYPIIAPFWADVDTRLCHGTVSYGCTTYDLKAPEVGSRPAMVIRWDNVGYFNQHGDKRNSFQLTIIDRSSDRGPGDFDFEFSYDQIRWEAGDVNGGVNGLIPANVAGNSARSGYACGPQTFYELTGSGTKGALLDNGTSPLVFNSLNSTVPGAYYFYVTNCVPTTNSPAITNGPPVARAGLNRIACPTGTNCCASVQLNGLLSSDPDSGDTLTYTWSTNGNVIVNANGATPTVEVCGVGDQVIQLEVTDGHGHRSIANVTITINDCTPLANDDCTNAIPLLVGSPAACGSTVCATPSLAGTLIPIPCGLSADAPDVWYTFTPQCDGQITIDTCGSCTNQPGVFANQPDGFDTVLSVYTGACGLLTEVPDGCDDDDPTGICGLRSRVTFTGTAGVTYRIRVAGYAGESGPFQLNISTSVTPPRNDECTNAVALAAGYICDSTVCATPSATGSIPIHGGSSADAPDVWYTFKPECDGQITIDTCDECVGQPVGFDTVLSVYTGQCGSFTLVPFGWNDDDDYFEWCLLRSRVIFTGTAGVTYYIRVAGSSSGASGKFALTISQAAPPVPANDLCANATPVNNGSYAFSICGANTEGPNQPGCQPYHDVWFRYTPTNCSGQVWIDTCKSGFNTVLSVYSGPCSALALVPNGCNDDALAGPCTGTQSSFVSFNATAGTTYYIRVGAYDANLFTGAGLLTIQGPFPPLGTCIATANPKLGRAFRIMGPPNNTPWSWSISVACCINIGTNVPGVPSGGDANTLAAAFANSINSACPDGGVTVATYPNNPNVPGLMVVDVSSCTGVLTPFVFRVGPVNASQQDQCVVADVNVTGNGPLPTVGACSFNPEIIELPLSGHDFNNNGVDDAIDIMAGTSADLNGNGIPDESESCLAPDFTAKADSRVVKVGDTVTLTVTATGTAPLHYQWSLAGVPLNDSGAISGSRSNTLTIQNVASTNLGNYSVTVSNSCGVIFSVPTTLSTETVARPVIVNMAPLKGTFQFAFETKAGRTYVVEYKNNLTDPSWTQLETVIGDGLKHIVADSGPLPTARFYRVRMTTP